MTEQSALRLLTENTLDGLLTPLSPAGLKLELTLNELTRARVTLDLMAVLLKTVRESSPSLKPSIDRALALYERPAGAELTQATVLAQNHQLIRALSRVHQMLESGKATGECSAFIEATLTEHDAHNLGLAPLSDTGLGPVF